MKSFSQLTEILIDPIFIAQLLMPRTIFVTLHGVASPSKSKIMQNYHLSLSDLFC